MKYLYHYTTVESLKSILENRSIRFMPLSSLNDKQEGLSADSAFMGNYIFTSSWSEVEQEMIPMWYMYGDHYHGVRIGLPESPFENYSYTAEEQLAYGITPSKEGILQSIIPLSDIINDNYLITPFNSSTLLHRIEYTDDMDKLYPKLWVENSSNTQFSYGKLGRYKNEYWRFEKEYRYILTVLPISFRYYCGAIETNPIELLDATRKVYEGKTPCPLDHYDLQIDPYMFDRMEVVLGPTISKDTEKSITSIIKAHSDRIIIKNSSLTGLIRERTVKN